MHLSSLKRNIRFYSRAVPPIKPRLTGILLACGCLASCGSGIAQQSDSKDVKPPPYVVPLFDGKENPSKAPPDGEYKLAPLPNARELFDMVAACWPEKSWFRGELSAESRVGKTVSDSTVGSSTSFDPVTGQYTTTSNGSQASVGVVFRIPLFSAIELDKEREREIMRRGKIADSVGVFINSLAEYQMGEREMAIMKSLERRSQERVSLGVADTNEQVKYLEKVAQIDRNLIGVRARLITSRIALQGMCDERKSWIVDEYLKRFKDVE